MSKKSGATLMTEGPIWKRILLFAIPMFWGNLFQQLYNTADSLIVGRFLGEQALAAVSSSSSLIFLLVGFFNGLSMGAGVVIARFFGAQDHDKVHRSIHTTVALGLICSVILTVLGFFAAPVLLQLMGTPADVLPQSLTYFRIYFSGSVGFIMYNCFMGILRAVGDSKHPLMYLIIASVLNIILDIFFIAGLGFGIGAAALATIISQFISAFLCMIQLCRSPEEFRLYPKKLCLDKELLKLIIKNGLPAGMEGSIISFANVFIQSSINSFGSLAVAGCGAYLKIQGFGFLPVNCFTMALSTFISQNLGAKMHDRAKKGAIFGISCCLILAEIIGILSHIFAPHLIALFSESPEVIQCGVDYARTNGFFFFLCAFTHCSASILRGAGRPTAPMGIMLICWCAVRVAYISIVVKMIPSIGVIFWAYPLTWTISSVVFLIYLLKSNWLHTLD